MVKQSKPSSFSLTWENCLSPAVIDKRSKPNLRFQKWVEHLNPGLVLWYGWIIWTQLTFVIWVDIQTQLTFLDLGGHSKPSSCSLIDVDNFIRVVSWFASRRLRPVHSSPVRRLPVAANKPKFLQYNLHRSIYVFVIRLSFFAQKK